MLTMGGLASKGQALTDFERLLEQATAAGEKAMYAAMEIAAAKRVLEETLQRAGDAEHSDATEKATMIAVWRATLEQLNKASGVLSGHFER